jgi:hypothetical protein
LYIKNQHSGEAVTHDVTNWFDGFGKNCDLAATPYTIKNADNSAYNDGNVYVDGSYMLRIKTTTPYIKTLKVYATTALGV